MRRPRFSDFIPTFSSTQPSLERKAKHLKLSGRKFPSNGWIHIAWNSHSPGIIAMIHQDDGDSAAIKAEPPPHQLSQLLHKLFTSTSFHHSFTFPVVSSWIFTSKNRKLSMQLPCWNGWQWIVGSGGGKKSSGSFAVSSLYCGRHAQMVAVMSYTIPQTWETGTLYI